MWPKNYSNHTNDHKHDPEEPSQHLHPEHSPPAVLYDLRLPHQTGGCTVRPVRVHLLHPEAHCGQDDVAGVGAVTLKGEHHSLVHCGGQCNRQPEGHRGQAGQYEGVTGEGAGVSGLQGGEVAAQRTGQGWWTVRVPGHKGAQLDPLETLCAEGMQALQHARAFVVWVVLLVADGALHIHVVSWGRG